MGGNLHVFGKTVLESSRAEKLACARREHRLFGLAGALGEPDAHERHAQGDEVRRIGIGTFSFFELDIGIGMAAGKQRGNIPIRAVCQNTAWRY